VVYASDIIPRMVKSVIFGKVPVRDAVAKAAEEIDAVAKTVARQQKEHEAAEKRKPRSQ